MVSRRISRLIASCGIIVLGAVAGCGSGAGASGEIQVWALQDATLNKIEQASIDRFNDSADEGSATLETFGNDPYKQRLRVALGSPEAPDVFFNWGGGNLKEYVDAGRVRDLTELLDRNPELKKAFIPSVLDAAKIGGRHYGLPMRGVQPVVLYYNKKVFADAGAKPPRTYDDLLNLVDTFANEGVTPIALAGSQAWTELMWAEYLLDRIGGPEVFRAIRNGDSAAWRHPAVLSALGTIRELVDRGAFGTRYASVGYDVGGASTLLAQGKAAMHLMGSWEYTNQLGQSPEFVTSGDLGWAPFPVVEGGEGNPANVVGNPTNFYSIAATSEHPETAEAYLSNSLTDPRYVEDLIAAGDVPAVAGVRDDLATTDNADHSTWIYDLVTEAPSFQLSWDQDLPAEQAQRMLTQLQKLFIGEQTPEGFVDAMSAGQ